MDHTAQISSEMKKRNLFTHFSLIVTKAVRCPEEVYCTV